MIFNIAQASSTSPNTRIKKMFVANATTIHSPSAEVFPCRQTELADTDSYPYTSIQARPILNNDRYRDPFRRYRDTRTVDRDPSDGKGKSGIDEVFRVSDVCAR